MTSLSDFFGIKTSTFYQPLLHYFNPCDRICMYSIYDVIKRIQKEMGKMSEYRKPYLILWAGITDARAAMENRNYGFADQLLKQAQQSAEEAYIDYAEKEAPTE